MEPIKVDNEGRVIFPKVLQKHFKFRPGELYDYEIDVNRNTGEKLVAFIPLKARCVFCEKTENLTFINLQYICSQCINEIKKL